MSRMRAGLFFGIVLVMLMIVSPSLAAINVVPAPGDHVFIGEEGLDVSAALGTTSACTIGYYTGGKDPSVDVPDATVTVANPQNFYVSSSTFLGKTGVWYVRNGGVTDTTHLIYIDMPNTAVYMRNSVGDDITGKAVTRGEDINFRVETNLYAIQQRDPAAPFNFKIVVESPDGVTYTALAISSSASKGLTNLPVNSDLWLWGDGVAPVGLWDTAAKDGAGNNQYKSGQYKVSAECNANKIKDNYNYEGATRGVVKTITIASDTLDIASNKETVIRGEQFTITITGIPSTGYNVFVKSVGSDIPPKITSSQEGVVKTNDYTAVVTTGTSGTRTVGFYTDKDTKDKKWTIRVETLSADKYDEVSVNVKPGAVTAVSEGDTSFYLGKEVKITGTNTETDTVYFFMTGPNLPSAGGRLDSPQVAVVDGNPSTFATADVKDDKTYEYKWNTANLAIDSGSYSVYAVSEPRNRDNLADVQYAILSVNLRKPFVTASIAPSVAASGDKIHITGSAGVQTSQGLAVWIMGKNFVKYTTVSIEDDGTYDYELKSGDTQNMATGQYYVVVQHPMYNDKFDVYAKADGGYPYRYVVGPYPVLSAENILFTLQGPGSLQGSDAAQALIEAIDNAAVDDMGASTNFVIENPQINIIPISDVTIGQEFTVRGLTNLAVDNELLIEIVSSSFGPTEKTQGSGFSGFSGTTKVVRGDNTAMNSFSIVVPSANFVEDEYIITASSVLVDVSGSTVFNAKEFVPTPTPTPTPVPTTVVTTPPTPVPTTETPTPTPVPTKTPGFGALIALVGIGATGYLVVRKKPEEEEHGN